MGQFEQTALRAIVSQLREQQAAEHAPSTLLPNVLGRTLSADKYFSIESPIGPVFVTYNVHGISAVRSAASAAAFVENFHAVFGREVHPSAQPPEGMRHAVEAQLRGRRGTRRGNSLRYDLRDLSEFEQAVLMKALEIPFGEVRPYAWVAREIGHPGAVRAVGTALGHNPVPLLIPCHRVVRSDGTLGSYSLGGPFNKRALLSAEGISVETLEALAQRRVRYIGSDTTHIYCFPTCRHARRIGEAHRVTFGTDAEAGAAGYRPCRVCRPAREA